LLLFPPTDHSLETTTTTDKPIENVGLVRLLQNIGFTNGDAHKAIVKAVHTFGDDGFTVLHDWIDYVQTQETIRNPAGLIRARLRDGERAPKLPTSNGNGDGNPVTPQTPEMREI
jgi:hypothetical protein